jgi:VanZ family protein
MTIALLQRILWCVWALAVALTPVAGLMPQLSPPGEYEADKFIHIGVFFCLGLPPALMMKQGAARWSALLLVALMGLGVEIAQNFVHGRTGSLSDLMADLVGVAMAIVLTLWLRRRLLRLAFLQPRA